MISVYGALYLFSHRAWRSARPENFRQSRDSLKPAATALAGHRQRQGTARWRLRVLQSGPGRFRASCAPPPGGEHDLESITRLLLRDLETGALVPPDELKLRKWSKGDTANGSPELSGDGDALLAAGHPGA